MTSIFINLLTFTRIIFAVIIFLLLTLNDYYLIALMLFLVAGVTDYLDGFIARKLSLTSVLGEILDPIADKVLVVFLLIGLAVNLSSYLLGFAASIIITREIWVSALRDINARKNNLSATKVIFLAKFKTSVQLLTILIYLLALTINNMFLIVIGDIFIIISVLITLYTGYIYTINTFK